jgi:hypothetical protein
VSPRRYWPRQFDSPAKAGRGRVRASLRGQSSRHRPGSLDGSPSISRSCRSYWGRLTAAKSERLRSSRKGGSLRCHQTAGPMRRRSCRHKGNEASERQSSRPPQRRISGLTSHHRVVLDEFGVPTRRVGGNIGDQATQETGQELTVVPVRNHNECRPPSRSFDRGRSGLALLRSRCGTIGADVRPNWRERERQPWRTSHLSLEPLEWLSQNLEFEPY